MRKADQLAFWKCSWGADLGQIIDHFRIWLRSWYSFVFMLIRSTGLTFVQVFLRISPMAAGWERLISIKTKEYLIWLPLWKRPIGSLMSNDGCGVKNITFKETIRRYWLLSDFCGLFAFYIVGKVRYTWSTIRAPLKQIWRTKDLLLCFLVVVETLNWAF